MILLDICFKKCGCISDTNLKHGNSKLLIENCFKIKTATYNANNITYNTKLLIHVQIMIF